MPSLSELKKMFSKEEVTQMNKELKTYMEENKVLIAVFGYQNVLSNGAYEIYRKHGGN